MLNIARQRDPAGAIRWQEGSVQAMPFADGEFTLALCQQGLQYFPDRLAALREMQRVLAPAGRAVMCVWRAVERSPGFLALGQALARHLRPDLGILPPFTLGDGEGLAAEVAAAGFRDVTTRIASKPLRYPSTEAFIGTFLSATPLAELLAQAEAATRHAVLADVSAALHPYTDDSGLAFPIENQFILASRR
jgi:SAM-dependent methyltransferase